MCGGVNAFGDRYYIHCRGMVIVTDLRVIFLPSEVDSPAWLGYPSLPMCTSHSYWEKSLLPSVHSRTEHRHTYNPIDTVHCQRFSQEQLLLLKRCSYQLPVSAVQDIRYTTISASTDGTTALDKLCACMVIEGRDGSVFEAQLPVKRRLGRDGSYFSGLVEGSRGASPLFSGPGPTDSESRPTSTSLPTTGSTSHSSYTSLNSAARNNSASTSGLTGASVDVEALVDWPAESVGCHLPLGWSPLSYSDLYACGLVCVI